MGENELGVGLVFREQLHSFLFCIGWALGVHHGDTLRLPLFAVPLRPLHQPARVTRAKLYCLWHGNGVEQLTFQKQ